MIVLGVKLLPGHPLTVLVVVRSDEIHKLVSNTECI